MSESEVKSLTTGSLITTSFSKTGSSMKDLNKLAVAADLGLHERCNMREMCKIKNYFESTYTGKVTAPELRELLRDIVNIEFTDEEYNILFLKMNSNRDGIVTWDEFISYLLSGYYEDDIENQRETLTLPILGLPRIQRSHHRHPISRITFWPDVERDRTTDSVQGRYVTASRDGMVKWWTLDMIPLRTAFSTCPFLKVQTTWVTDMVCMPDVNILVTSSTERDLRFYDCTAKTFSLKMIISSWEFMICTMFYHFHQDMKEDNILICGDVGGNIRVLRFTPKLRGPFQNKPGKTLIDIRHIDLKKKRLPSLKLSEFKHVHSDWVRQVAYYASLRSFISCATCDEAMVVCGIDATVNKRYTVFYVPRGLYCFDFDDEKHMIVTGGPDRKVRTWNTFVPAKPTLVLIGHHAGVVAVIQQDGGSKIYSIGRDRIIKCWDVQQQICIQTYAHIPAERSPVSVYYNRNTRECIMASLKITTVILDEKLNHLHTDGFTHSRAVTRVLYNPLFRNIITCGMDSIIISWNPLTGKRLMMVREAHTEILHGETITVEITAACFDPGLLLLLTGARNGTLKVWNFNSGSCIRNMMIDRNCAVTDVYWVEGRIFAVGWNKYITEFEDTGTAQEGKSWEKRHDEDILAAAVRGITTIITTSYSGELVMWKLETGQPYRRFFCSDPTTRIKLVYTKKQVSKQKPVQPSKRPTSANVPAGMITCPKSYQIDMEEAVEKAKIRKQPNEALDLQAETIRKIAVHAAIFLETRESEAKVANLLIAVENGMIQYWSDHPGGGYLGSFYAVHRMGSYVSCMKTDTNNDYIFCGTTTGYIKIFLMTNFQVGQDVHINMPALRLQFPFLWKDRIEGRAKRRVREQPLPILCSSYRGHLRSITYIAFIEDSQLVLSGSTDKSVRIWRLSGEYLQTLGTFRPWTLETPSYPPDVKKVASFTTMKVWNHGEVSRYVPGQKVVEKNADVTEEEMLNKTYGVRLEEPILGHYFELPKRPDRQDKIVLDDRMPVIPIYVHLRLASSMPVKRPPTPPIVKEMRLKKELEDKLKHARRKQGDDE